MRTLAAVLVLLSAIAATPTVSVTARESVDERIDPPLAAALASGERSLPVFALLAEQSGLDVAAYRARADLDRSAWRDHAIARMRKVAETGRAELVRAAREAGHALEIERSFWIVNGVGLDLEPNAVRWLAASGLVARLFLRATKPADLTEREGRFTQAFEQRDPGIVSIGEVLAHDDLSWNLRRIQADLVWSRLGLIGRGVVLALLDSGVNYRHSDFRHHLWRNPGEIERNGVDDDGNGYVDDIYGFNFANRNSNIGDDFFHGTSSASIMVGDGRGGMITGVAPGAQLMTLRVYDQMTRHNSTELWKAFQYDAWEGIQYAVAEGADVINMSVAWEPAENPLHAVWRIACTNAVAAGVVIVAGAGNFRGSYPLPGQVRPPASIPAVIATGGTFANDDVADLTSRGPVTWTDYPPFADYPLPTGLDPVAFSAPWGYFPVTVFSGRGYQMLAEQRGSSLTSPHVAGVIALMLEADSELRPDVIRERLALTAADVGEMGDDPYTGTGIVQAYDAILPDEIARPRLGAVRFLSAEGHRAPRPGERATVIVELHNRGKTDVGAQVRLHGPAGPASDVQQVESLPAVVELRMPVELPATARPGSTFPLELEVRTSRGLRVLLPFELPVWGSDLLVVDDDGGGDYERAWRDSLDRQDIAHDLLPTWPAPRVPIPDLRDYARVIWLLGEEAYETLEPALQTHLAEYVERGGRLVLVGQNVARDLAGTPLLINLGVAYKDDFVRMQRLVGRGPDGAERFALQFTSYPTLPDRLAAVGRGRVLFDDGAEDPAPVAIATGHSVVLSIEIAGIADVAARDRIVRLLLDGGAIPR